MPACCMRARCKFYLAPQNGILRLQLGDLLVQHRHKGDHGCHLHMANQLDILLEVTMIFVELLEVADDRLAGLLLVSACK